MDIRILSRAVGFVGGVFCSVAALNAIDSGRVGIGLVLMIIATLNGYFMFKDKA